MDVVPLDDTDGARITGFAAGEALVELLEPAQADSPIAKFITKRGPGIHHVCFAVEDLAGTLQRCRAAGIRLIDEQPRVGAEGKHIAFLHPSSTFGAQRGFALQRSVRDSMSKERTYHRPPGPATA